MSYFAPFFFPAGAKPRLVIVGGRLEDDNRAVYREMRRLSQGRILIFPTASSEPEEVAEETRAAFATHGFDAHIAPLTIANAAHFADDPALAAQIAEVGSVYFTGGDQAHILAALAPEGRETRALGAVRAALANGGLLAGSSAGAAAMSRHMILGGTSFEAIAHGVTATPDTPGIIVGRGLGFFSQGLIDQHFIKRGRLARLVVAMAHAEEDYGFGIDENTALVVEGQSAQVVGEYGVFFVDMTKARIDPATQRYEDIRLSYLDDGDMIDLRSFKPRPGESKRRVRTREIAYRAPARSRRNAFGAYALYDLVARLVLSDQRAYAADALTSDDVRAGVSAKVEIGRVKGRTRCLIATPPEGLRVTAINLRASITSEPCPIEALAPADERSARRFGMDLNERSRIILLGSSPLYSTPEAQAEIASQIEGPIGVFAAASAEAKRTAAEYVAFFAAHGLQAEDLGVTIETVDYAAQDEAMLDRIAAMRTIFLAGGNQSRLVETLLRRGEESAVFQALAKAYASGATLIASGGAASALSGVMIAGGSSTDALRYGVASAVGHNGLVIQEGVGLFASGIADQNIIAARRLGRLVVACVEQNERYGIGVCEESGVVAIKSGRELKALGRYGFVQVETDPVKHAPVDDRFLARGVRLRMFAPGDRINLHTGHVERQSAPSPAAIGSFERMLADLMSENHERKSETGEVLGRHSVRLQIHRADAMSALLDVECAREEHDDN